MPLKSALRQAILSALAVLATSPAFAVDRDCPSGTLYSRSLNGTVECVRAAAAGSEPNSARVDPSAAAGSPAEKPNRDAGSWTLPSTSATRSSPNACIAIYQQRGQTVSIALLGGAKPSAQLLFSGPLVPKPSKSNQRVDVTLRQPGEAAQTVQAGHSAQGASRGSLMLAVPSVQAALNSIEERNAFELTLNGAKVIDIAWEDGRTAKTALEKCWAGR
jgi:hypothetical protein